jgi:hypothetical protein
MTVLYVLATIWLVVAFRRVGKKPPTIFKWSWLLGAIVILSFVVEAVLATID